MSQLALQLIAENKKTKNPFLDLGNCALKKIPEELTELTHLNVLSFGSYHYDWIKNRYILSENYLSFNQIIDGRFLEELTNLTSLNLSDNQIIDWRFLEELKNLTSLDISFSQIRDGRFLEKLTNLTSLDLSCNQIRDWQFLEKLTNLTSLNLYSSQIRDGRFLEKLINLTSLDLSDNKITDGQFLEKLTNLTSLDLYRNKIKDGRFLEKLTNLTSLNLYRNKISNIKPLLSIISKRLPIYSEDRRSIGEKGINLSIDEITIPPPAIVREGNDAILRYFEGIEESGLDYIYEAKLTLVGEGGAGKTSLQKRILDDKAVLPRQDERTRGIEVADWSFSDEENKTYHTHIWDFGGQDVLYPVHRFFLTENSVFILMASTRTESHKFEYWIPTIYQFGGNSPVILVQNCFDGNRATWNEVSNFFTNPDFNLVKIGGELFATINLPNSNDGLSVITNHIKFQIKSLPHIGKPVPKSWLRVREELLEVAKQEACIRFERFAEICKTKDKKSFDSAEKIEDLGKFLHSLGIMLWFHKKEYLKEWIIIKPEWAMNAVYRIIDDEEVQKTGVIKDINFNKLWNEETYRQKHTLLKTMLKEFKIAFPKKHASTDHLLPARLKSLELAQRWTNTSQAIRLEYCFKFMPRGIVNQVSAELSRYITSDDEVWNNAVNLSKDGNTAQVEEDYYSRKIYIKAKGADARSLIVLIKESIDNILQDYRGVFPDIIVPCDCHKCQTVEKPTDFDYNELIGWYQEDNNREITCNKSQSKLSVRKLLFNIGFNFQSHGNPMAYPESLAYSKPFKMIKDVFISYSTKDQDAKNELAKIFDDEGITYWLDETDVNMGNNIDTELKEGIRKARFTVLLVSENSLLSFWVSNETLFRLKQEDFTGKTSLLPILLDKQAFNDDFVFKMYDKLAEEMTRQKKFRTMAENRSMKTNLYNERVQRLEEVLPDITTIIQKITASLSADFTKPDRKDKDLKKLIATIKK